MSVFLNNTELHDEQGAPVVASAVHAFSKENGTFAGDPAGPYLAPPAAQSMFDLQVSTQLYVQGGRIWAKSPTFGDYAEFSVVDKDDILGLFSVYGLTVGQDVLELHKYVRKYHLPPWDVTFELRAPTAAAVLPGLYLRTIYNNVGAAPVEFGVAYVWYEA